MLTKKNFKLMYLNKNVIGYVASVIYITCCSLVSFYYFTENNKLLHKLDVLENSYKATIKELTVCYKTIAQNTEQIELLQRKISNIEKGGEASKIFGFIPSDLIANPIVIYGGAATIGCIAIWACTGINIPQVMFD